VSVEQQIAKLELEVKRQADATERLAKTMESVANYLGRMAYEGIYIDNLKDVRQGANNNNR